jgi:DNA polymerase-3 subunit epsilon
MRQVFLDTETTGLSPAQGHRIIEIAAVEVINRRVTKNHFHVYLNPDREIDAAAQEVHGITLDSLQNKPRFKDVVDEFLDFVADAELVIHNAPFDVSFLNSELGRIDRQNLEKTASNIVDTLKMAKDMRPGQRNNLDALCRHFGIDNSKRTLHGALLDAELLADVYMAMTRGQESLMMDLVEESVDEQDLDGDVESRTMRVLMATPDELAAHQEYLQGLSQMGDSVWESLQKAPQDAELS